MRPQPHGDHTHGPSSVLFKAIGDFLVTVGVVALNPHPNLGPRYSFEKSLAGPWPF